MSRIEIPYEEYVALNEKIKELEKKEVSLSEAVKAKQEELNLLKDLSMEVVNEPLFGRVFKWKKVTEEIKDILK